MKPTTKPGAIEKAGGKENVHLVVRDKDGNVKAERKATNLIVTTGRDSWAAQLLASPGVEKPTHMAVGTGAVAPAAGDTTLGTEVVRQALDSKTRSDNVVTMVNEFADGSAEGAITEAGILNAAEAGTLYSRVTFDVLNIGSSDDLTITWTYTLTIT